jgi:hypothetical protein
MGENAGDVCLVKIVGVVVAVVLVVVGVGVVVDCDWGGAGDVVGEGRCS